MANQVLWFLYALFICKLVAILTKNNKAVKIIIIALSMAFVFVYAYTDFSFKELFRISILGWTIPSIGFFFMGNLLKNYMLTVENNKKAEKYTYVIGAISLIVYIALYRISPFVSIKELKIQIPILFYVNASLAIIIVIALCLLISKIKPLAKIVNYYGVNSLYVMIYHMYFTRYLFPYIIVFVLNKEQYLYHPLVELLLWFITILLMIIMIKISDKYLYFLFGKKKVNKND